MTDDRSRLAGRLAYLVPMVSMITASAVTSFLAIYNSEHIFPVSAERLGGGRRREPGRDHRRRRPGRPAGASG